MQEELAMVSGEVLKWIEQCGDAGLNEIVKAVIRRYAQCHPDYEVVFYSLPKGNGRAEAIAELIGFLDEYQ